MGRSEELGWRLIGVLTTAECPEEILTCSLVSRRCCILPAASVRRGGRLVPVFGRYLWPETLKSLTFNSILLSALTFGQRFLKSPCSLILIHQCRFKLHFRNVDLEVCNDVLLLRVLLFSKFCSGDMNQLTDHHEPTR